MPPDTPQNIAKGFSTVFHPMDIVNDRKKVYKNLLPKNGLKLGHLQDGRH